MIFVPIVDIFSIVATECSVVLCAIICVLVIIVAICIVFIVEQGGTGEGKKDVKVLI